MAQRPKDVRVKDHTEVGSVGSSVAKASVWSWIMTHPDNSSRWVMVIPWFPASSVSGHQSPNDEKCNPRNNTLADSTWTSFQYYFSKPSPLLIHLGGWDNDESRLTVNVDLSPANTLQDKMPHTKVFLNIRSLCKSFAQFKLQLPSNNLVEQSRTSAEDGEEGRHDLERSQ